MTSRAIDRRASPIAPGDDVLPSSDDLLRGLSLLSPNIYALVAREIPNPRPDYLQRARESTLLFCTILLFRLFVGIPNLFERRRIHLCRCRGGGRVYLDLAPSASRANLAPGAKKRSRLHNYISSFEKSFYRIVTEIVDRMYRARSRRQCIRDCRPSNPAKPADEKSAGELWPYRKRPRVNNFIMTVRLRCAWEKCSRTGFPLKRSGGGGEGGRKTRNALGIARPERYRSFATVVIASIVVTTGRRG